MKLRIRAATAALMLVSASAAAQHSDVALNGQILSQQQLAALEVQLGTRIAPGSYVVDYQSGCWANLSTGQQGCGVGGSGDGCVYAFGWSNC